MTKFDNKIRKDDLSDYNKDLYEKPSVTVDVAVCTIFDNELKVLLIKRKHPPFRDQWALPGGFVDITKNENLDQTALSALSRETNIKNIYIEQLKTYGDPNRDPRLRVITVVYFALIDYEKISTQQIFPFDDAEDISWFNLRIPPEKMAFDHNNILQDLLIRLEGKISYTPIAFNLVPDNFTWSGLQRVYEIVLNKTLITPNFRRKIKDMYSIKELKGKRITNEPGRPPVYLQFESIKKMY